MTTISYAEPNMPDDRQLAALLQDHLKSQRTRSPLDMPSGTTLSGFRRGNQYLGGST